MKIIEIIIILFTTIYLFSCTNPYEGEGDWQEDWIATINSTGDSLNYIEEGNPRVQFIPNTTKIMLSNSDSITIMNFDGTGKETIIDSVEGGTGFPCISLDGTKLTFSNYDIYIANIDGSNLTNLTNTSDIIELYPQFSSDGDSIVYTTILDTFYSISVIDEFGNNKIEVISNSTKYSNYSYPIFDKSVEKIFYKFNGLPSGLYSVNVDGSDNTILYEGWIGYNLPSMSLDGGKIVFWADGHIYIMNEDGTEITDLGEAYNSKCNPMISYDGSKIVFGYNYIYIMNYDGTERKEIASGRNPVFSSDGKKIVFIAIREFPED